MKKTKKGFTLIELLAVIVVLAVLILLAMPSVLGMMTKAQRNAFVVEANEVINNAHLAYADAAMSGVQTNFCITMRDLVTKGYMKKNLGGTDVTTDTFKGKVTITTVAATGAVTIKLWLTNGSYWIGAANATGGLTSDVVAATNFGESSSLLTAKPNNWENFINCP